MVDLLTNRRDIKNEDYESKILVFGDAKVVAMKWLLNGIVNTSYTTTQKKETTIENHHHFFRAKLLENSCSNLCVFDFIFVLFIS